MSDQAIGVLPAGSIYHTGYVVPNVQAAIRQWVELAGVGPFVVFEEFAFVDPVYRCHAGGPRVTLAFGAFGDQCIELIQPLDDAPSIYTEIAGSMHHIGIGVSSLEAGLAPYERAGVTCAFRAAFPFGGGCAYLDTRETLGVFTELVELGPVVDGMLAGMKQAHATWDRRSYTFTLG